jgi:hypothetical protein
VACHLNGRGGMKAISCMLTSATSLLAPGMQQLLPQPCFFSATAGLQCPGSLPAALHTPRCTCLWHMGRSQAAAAGLTAVSCASATCSCLVGTFLGV